MEICSSVLIVKLFRTFLGQNRGPRRLGLRPAAGGPTHHPKPMPNGPMSKGASPTNEPMANGLELPEASNAAAVADIAAAEAGADAEAPRRKAPNNHVVIIVVDDNAFPTSCVRRRINAIQTLSAPHMVQQHHYCCL